MLSEIEKEQIDREVAAVPVKEAAGIEALKIIQQHRGWVSDESLREVAAYLGVAPEELDSVATFYNLIFRQPVGRHIILLCDSISCWVMGYEQLRTQLQHKLGIGFGQTTADGCFTLLPNPCLGTCDHAPALMIDGDLYKDVSVEMLEEVLSKYK
ncbi:NADH dehydrogenase subunit E [Anseongella ginsenosidimutans]|uniref:NADH dehydrogenase subunit E n=1 Tax=Anseongella ginsenosidimutans TaxID=496056 RepID=A0A4R3KR50_9SPHI|nr:NADH-quinone oxidoreductase subunit NuoE [Anseongella ginsenosidimutans]QEC52285.1 NADH-quinone oxidoreductase subunit NuoE [Anseongella ginsenosidimutans]TCS86843.1 NADH dehydrogenase subunit E [Anseongella ginsenosidimutans]